MTTRYDSWADVFDYCRRSANPVGRLVLRIAGYRDEALDRSSDALCTALQLTNFWQDFGRDWLIGRLYVPRDVDGGLPRPRDGSERPAAERRVARPRCAQCVEQTRAQFDAGRAVCDGVRGRLRYELRFTWLGGDADPRAGRAHRRRPADRSGRRSARATSRFCSGAPRAGRLAARNIAMARKTSFYYSFLVLPPEQRRAIIAVWDFCRAVDDAVDEEPSVADGLPTGRAAVAFWREELARVFAGQPPATGQGRRLQPFVREFDLPRQAFDDVIDGVAMDLDTTRYQTFDDLFEYCRRVASAVGLICIRIFGCRNDGVARLRAEPRRRAAADQHPARREGRSRARPRLPAARRSRRPAAARSTISTAGVVTEPVRALIEFECRRAREFYQRAIDARPAEDRQRLVAAEIMRAVYFETLKRIERSGYDVFTARARVPKPRQALIALRQWLWTLTRPDVIVIGAGFAGLSAAVRLTRAGRARARARGAVAARRPRDRVSRSRHRRARRQRPARPDGLLHRDVRVPARHRRAGQRPPRAAAGGHDDRSRGQADAPQLPVAAGAAASGGRRARVGGAVAGAIGCRCWGWRRR